MSDSDRSSRTNSSCGGRFYFVQPLATSSNKGEIEIFVNSRRLIPDEVEVVELSESECLERIIQRPSSSLFVLANFDDQNQVFQHLKSLHCCIVGAPMVISCIENSRPLPKSRKPIFCDVMRPVYVCCTNMEREKRESACQLIEYMCGHFKRDFEENVNILIAESVGSLKYEVAASRNIPIVKLEWVFECWRRVKSGERIDPIQVDFYHQFVCPPLLGLTISLSGLRAEERKKAENLIRQNGGIYRGDMKLGETTHLITNVPNGTKYEAARTWEGVKIVKVKWLDDSVERGYCMKESSYAVDADQKKGQKISTPTNVHTTPRFSMLDPNCSVIPRKDAANSTELSNASFVGVCRVDETSLSTTSKTNAAPNEDDTLLFARPSTSTLDICSNTPIEDLDLTITTTGDFLKSTRIYVGVFPFKQAEKLRKIVNAGGGQRCTTLSEHVTHAILGSNVDPTLVDSIEALKCRPHVLTVQWLVQSFKCGKLKPVDSYLHPKFQSGLNKAKCSGEGNKKVQMVEEPMDELLSQYVVEESDVAPADGTSTICRNLSDFSTVDPEMGAGEGPEVVDEEDDKTNVEEEEETRVYLPIEGLFEGKRLNFVGFDEDEVGNLAELVGCRKERFQKESRPLFDFVVVPLISTIETSNGEVVTKCWLEMCLERDELLPVDGSPLFKPVKIPSDCRVLDTCVICISQYAGAEREALKKLAEVLGAKTQEHFSRCDKKDVGVLACTHLILINPEGAKYSKAVEWRIPAVGVGWLLESASSLTKADEREFAMGNNAIDNDLACGSKDDNRTNVDGRNKTAESRQPIKGETSKSDENEPVFDTPGKFMNPNESFRPKFDCTDGFNYLAAAKKAKKRKQTLDDDILLSNRVSTQLNLAVLATEQAPTVYPSQSSKKYKTALSSQRPQFSQMREECVPGSACKTPTCRSAFNQLNEANDIRFNLTKHLNEVLSASKTPNSLENGACESNAAAGEDSSDEGSSTSGASTVPSTKDGESDSQAFRIEWEDPKQRLRRAAIQPLLKSCSEPTQNLLGNFPTELLHADEFITDDEDCVLVAKEEKKYKFLFTSADHIKTRCVDVIKSLGAEYVDEKTFNETCTHLIAGKLTRNEKLLTSIVTGKWILHPSYLDDSKKAGKFLEESAYEWGDEGIFAKHVANSTPIVKNLAVACKKWRQKLCRSHLKPYDGWNVVLFVEKHLESGLTMLLKHGGAVLREKNSSTTQMTHVFVSDKCAANNSDLNRLRKAKVKCFKPEFIASYLIDDPVDEQTFTI